MAINAEGRIFFGALDNFGYLDRSANGKYHYVSLLEKSKIRTIVGNISNISPQTFKAGSMTIIITGNGHLNSDKLTFEYTIDRGDGDPHEHACLASKTQ